MIDYFILAGGYGSRLMPLSRICPKPLLPLNGVPLLKRMIKQVSSFNLNRGFINIHYMGDLVKKSLTDYTDISVLLEEELSGNRILQKAYDLMKGDFLLVVNGDVFLDIPLQDLYQRIEKDKSEAVILIKQINRGGYNNIVVEDGLFSKRSHPLSHRSLVFCGVALFRKSIIFEMNRKNFFDLFEQGNYKISCHMFSDSWYDIGDLKTYFTSDKQIRERENPFSKNSFSQNVILENSNLSNTIVWENSFIKNCQINNSIITNDLCLNGINCSNKIVIKNLQEEIDFIDFYPEE